MATIFLRGLAGVTVPIELSSESISVAELRDIVELKEGIPADQQILTCKGRNIGHSGSYEHSADATIFVSVGLNGGGKKNQKGRRRQFMTGEGEQADREKADRQAKWGASKGGDSDESESEDETPVVAKKKTKAKKPVQLDEYGIPITDSEESSEEEELDAFGNAPLRVHDLIEVSNPNRSKKQHKKVSDWDDEEEVAPLTRKEKEEVKEQEAARRYQKLHAAGKTDEARADMERLTLVREARAEAAEKKKLLDEEKARQQKR